MATALSPGLAAGGNQLRDLFLEPAEQALHPEWENVTECFVANLRQAVGTDIDDPRFIELTGELSLASPRFRQLWARHDVRGQRGTPLRINHPQVGEMTLNRERLAISGTEGLMLVVYHPDEGSSAADKLALLASAEGRAGGEGGGEQAAVRSGADACGGRDWDRGSSAQGRGEVWIVARGQELLA
ncbi:hypothetical protein Ga0074812_1304 [Parafrankia irregularis]|uniref:MmyB-like transcription regulator ligand binding domain-containing protein n=1 Tax=Parafrankia irregularis TaxID=795642 RepID=A0A0S4QXX9_9ACTN|nr:MULTISPECIES: hypothetical protein [Parafrankia]CUU59624.1 hypothetical protein Ga0074812_1304 [Parafrankia irregularis]